MSIHSRLLTPIKAFYCLSLEIVGPRHLHLSKARLSNNYGSSDQYSPVLSSWKIRDSNTKRI